MMAVNGFLSSVQLGSLGSSNSLALLWAEMWSVPNAAASHHSAIKPENLAVTFHYFVCPRQE